MSETTTPMRTPGSVAVAVVVTMMFVTPVLAATSLHPVGIRWTALSNFIAAHQLGLVLGFSLMIVIALLLKAAAANPAPRESTFSESIVRDVVPSGIDGLA